MFFAVGAHTTGTQITQILATSQESTVEASRVSTVAPGSMIKYILETSDLLESIPITLGSRLESVNSPWLWPKTPHEILSGSSSQ